MDDTEFRILDTLSRDPGRDVSISGLTREIRRLHGTAHYANTYRVLDRLRTEGIVGITKTGNSSLVSLDMGSRRTIDSLSEMELRKRRSLLSRREELQRLFDALSDGPAIGPTCLIDAERNATLNRAELLLLLPNWAAGGDTDETLRETLRTVEGKLTMRIDALGLHDEGFRSLLAARDRNPLKEMLSRQTTLLAPDLFWNQIRNAWAHGIRIQFDRQETNPAKISGRDLVHNLRRFGYAEFGSEASGGQDFAIESLVTALLLKGDARRIQAIPAILAKNRANYALLLFLSKKYGVQGELFGLLKVLANHREDPDLRIALRGLANAGVREVPANEASIVKTMRTYHALEGT